ncbi:MAG: hypothetical protein L0Y74_00375 [candidate division Zixibacteria bacterium]|nr:hypothetical protein [candidate division Zixibacteria bacterium]
MQTVESLFLDPFQAAWTQIATMLGGILPKLVAALIILFLGWLISKLLAGLARKLLFLIRFDRLVAKAGVEDFLAKGGVKKNSVQILGGVVYWFFLILTLITAFGVAGLDAAVDPLISILLYIPNIFIVILILTIGAYLATFADSAVKAYSANFGAGKPEAAGKIARILVLIFVLIIAFEQLQFKTEILSRVFLVVLASVGLGAAIAIGLGAKDTAKTYIDKLTGPAQ